MHRQHCQDEERLSHREMPRKSAIAASIVGLFASTSCATTSNPKLESTPLSWQNLPKGCSIYFYNSSHQSPLAWATYIPTQESKGKLIIGVNGEQVETAIANRTDTTIESAGGGYSALLSVNSWKKVAQEVQNSNGLLVIKPEEGGESLSIKGTAERGC